MDPLIKYIKLPVIKRASGFVLLAALTSFQAHAEDNEMLSGMTVKQRLERLERMLSSDVLRQQMQTSEALREEITLLREQLELQEYELENIKQRQRSLYLDMDRRIGNLEAGGTSRRSTSGAAPVPPPGAGSSTRPDNGSTVSDGDRHGKQAYTQAFDLLKDGKYQSSIKAFESFLKTYPQSKYADNAQYWLGEANYVSRNYKQALEEFQSLIARFPDSSKIPGARLKIGYVYYELNNWPASREALQLVLNSYPDTTVAKKASERLERIQREGH